jgi:hypothetical protein
MQPFIEDKAMRQVMRLVAVALLGGWAIPSAAQTSDELGATKEAIRYLRETLPERPLVVDAELYRAGPAITPAVASLVARDLGVRAARRRDAVKCDKAPPRTNPTCKPENVTVVGLSQSIVENGTARITVLWVYPDADGHLVGGGGPRAKR